MIDGTQGNMYLDTKDALQLMSQTLSILRQRVCTGEALAPLVGSWTWCLMLRRPGLSILRHTYRFVEVAGRRQNLAVGGERASGPVLPGTSASL